MVLGNQIVLLEKQEDKLTPNPSQNPLALIPSSLCIQTSFELNEANPLLKAYQDKLLSQEQNYLSFGFPLKVQNKLECFFAPTTFKSKFAMLDLSLPTQIDIDEICVLFLYPSLSLLCFYQNHSLEYCISSSSPSNLPFHHIQALFDYHAHLYCLSTLPSPPQELISTHSLVPLGKFFGESEDFSLHIKEIKILQSSSILPLSSPPPPTHHLFRFLTLSSTFFAFFTFLFCFFTHSPPKEDNRHLQILSSLTSLSDNHSLFVLLEELDKISKDSPLLSIELQNNYILTLNFHTPIPQNLINTLATKNYTSKIINPQTLEISL